MLGRLRLQGRLDNGGHQGHLGNGGRLCGLGCDGGSVLPRRNDRRRSLGPCDIHRSVEALSTLLEHRLQARAQRLTGTFDLDTRVDRFSRFGLFRLVESGPQTKGQQCDVCTCRKHGPPLRSIRFHGTLPRRLLRCLLRR